MSARRTALITGSTSGIGYGIAAEFARKDFNVVINGLGDAAEIEEKRQALSKLGQGEVHFDGANMLAPDEIAALVSGAEQRFGSVDVVIPNAGIQHVEKIDSFPVAKWDAIIGINLTSAFHLIRAALPGMKKRQHGRIIAMASAHALVASPYKSAYVAAKHGLLGLVKTVALEAAESGITANAICPGYVETPLVRDQIADTAKARGMSEEEVVQKVILEAQPTKQFVQVEQIAALALFLASDAAAQITGSAQVIDGGWTAH
ncbi:3-hydroxybutyrate dehydrogenase [Pseudohoeflea sp. DP4N28-3]|uniref:3-hydroxybutyrate dehydrogenase n=2 Tax=Pseudohoeflea coraliihabitans TaxID=2860393 RepID=A0ABS6WM31_9HYPH|nr:3-hydroxybutyrate dehydrogenase [Pseudohoeflea sp. DP4N28-3]MBW3096992.1 3-hydroxybutyrate dehydrogenase [Pseudohoeflea sp. DP4N28-3]